MNNLTCRTVALVSQLIQRRTPPSMKTRRRFTRHILSITVPAGVPRLTNTGVRPVGVEAPSVVARARATGALHHVLGAPGAGEARGTCARVPGRGGVVGDAATSVAARLGCAVVFVRAFRTCRRRDNCY